MPNKTTTAEECVIQVKQLRNDANGMKWDTGNHGCFAKYNSTGICNPDTCKEGACKSCWVCLFNGRYFCVFWSVNNKLAHLPSMKSVLSVNTVVVILIKYKFCCSNSTNYSRRNLDEGRKHYRTK